MSERIGEPWGTYRERGLQAEKKGKIFFEEKRRDEVLIEQHEEGGGGEEEGLKRILKLERRPEQFTRAPCGREGFPFVSRDGACKSFR